MTMRYKLRIERKYISEEFLMAAHQRGTVNMERNNNQFLTGHKRIKPRDLRYTPITSASDASDADDAVS